MAGRIRTIKPELLTDAKAARLSDAAWRCFVSCWLLADDYGRLAGDSMIVGGMVFPARPLKVDQALDEVTAAGMISRYVVRGQTYIQITNWAKHQRIDNAGKARCPGPEESDGCEIPRVAEKFREPPPDPDPERTPKGKRPLPPSWSPDETGRARAAELGLDLEREAADFRDWTLAKNQLYTNWDAAFRAHLNRRGPAKTAATPRKRDPMLDLLDRANAGSR